MVYPLREIEEKVRGMVPNFRRVANLLGGSWGGRNYHAAGSVQTFVVGAVVDPGAARWGACDGDRESTSW